MNTSILLLFLCIIANYSTCCDTDKETLMHAAISAQAQEYLAELPAPEPICELDKDRMHTFLHKRLLNTKNAGLAKIELSFLNSIGKHSTKRDFIEEIRAWYTAQHQDPNARVKHRYLLKASRSWQYRVSIELGCRPQFMKAYNKSYRKKVRIVSTKQFLKEAHKRYTNPELNQLHLDSSHALAQEILRLLSSPQETKQQKETT